MNITSTVNKKKDSLREIDVDTFDRAKWTAHEATEKEDLTEQPKMVDEAVEDMVEDAEDEAEDKPLLPDGYAMQGLDSDIYSLIFTSSVSGPGFWFALTICAFQTSIIALVLKNSFNFDDDVNPLKIPAGNDVEVTIASALLMFILPQVSDDMMEGIEFLIDGYHSEVLELCPHATMWKWFLAGFLHFGVGAVLIFDVFAVLMQQTTVINLGLKYCAFGFFAKIDNVAFSIAKKGVCSVPLQKEIKAVGNVEIRKTTAYTWTRRARDTFLTGGLMVGWAVIVYHQAIGNFVCDNLFVQLGDVFNPDVAEIAGMFDILGFEHKHDYRMVYEERSTGDYRLAYCSSMKKWTLTSFFDADDFDPCGDVLASSGTDEGYSILATKDSWQVRLPVGSGTKPFTHISMTCNECESKCGHGTCNEDDKCVCEDGHYGLNCEYESPCQTMTLNRLTAAFSPSGLQTFPTEFKMLTLSDGSPSSQREGVFQIEYKPVFYGKHGSTVYLMFFAGRRWVVADTVGGRYFDTEADVVDFMSNQTFSLIEPGMDFDPYFASAVMDVLTPADAATPERLKWFHVRKNGFEDDDADASWWEVAEDEPAGTSFHCAECNWDTNPCENGGECNDSSTCDCMPGTEGSLCEYETKCTDLAETGEMQGCFGNATCGADGKCTKCPFGTYGLRCQTVLPCNETAQFPGFALNEGCLQGGTCSESGECVCPEPTSGELCQYPLDEELVEAWDKFLE